MLKMRLQRRGKKNFATYRVVVAEHTAPLQGAFVADLGSYNPHTNTFNVDKDAVQEWLKKGVKPSPTIHNQLVEQKIISGEKATIWTAKPTETPETEAAPTAPAEAPTEAK